MPVSSTVWCGPVSRSPFTPHVEVQPAVARQRVEQVVEEADAGRALARARAVELSDERDVGLACVARWMSAVRLTRGAPWTRRARGSPRRGRARRLRARGGRRPRRAKIREPSGAGTWPGRGRSAKRAAPPVGSTWFEPGDVVAERRARARGPRTRSPRGSPSSASASASSPTSSRCSGAISSASSHRLAASTRPPAALQLRIGGARPPGARRSTSAHGVQQSGVRRDQRQSGLSSPCSAWASRSSAISSRIGAARSRRPPARSARPGRRCPPRRAPGASPPGPRGCPGPTITSTRGHATPCRRRARRSPARRPSGRPRSTPQSAQAARITGCARAPGPGGAQTAISLDAGHPRRDRAHDHRRRVGRAAAGHVDAARGRPGPPPPPPLALGELHQRPARAAAPRRRRARSAIAVRTRPARPARARRAQPSSSRGVDAQLARAELRSVEARGEARSTASSPPLAHLGEDRRARQRSDGGGARARTGGVSVRPARSSRART